MSADNRSVHTDALATLGIIIDDTQARDAIHLAVEPVTAGQRLHPGDHVGLDGERKAVRRGVKLLGIVDPFLDVNVDEGQKFWLIVYPRQISSLRHVWEHPDFVASGETGAAVSNKATSEKWLRDFVARSDCPDYDTVLKLAVGQSVTINEDYGPSYKDGDYIQINGSDAHGEIPPEFWTHVEIVSGQKIPQDERPTFFSCGC
ncbi:hypothetical protein NDK50_08180 [Paraburkholderia bryophila]|uniref:hypothetical protein n=1 Tax=Paraburkholderia bryophila TaxID=420952 RepID=UPI00234B019D|nr:hypothetical protein [Paraburkholderia bryophila]WCM21414.1 hypothetical protein NDK50_08180 [Paraburkholderia bryophila]